MNQDFETWLRLERGNSPATVKRLMRDLRRIDLENQEAHLLTRQGAGLRNDVHALNAWNEWRGDSRRWKAPRIQSQPFQAYNERERRELLDPRDGALQWAAVAAFNLHTGLRRGEVARFRDADLDWPYYEVRAPSKGGRRRRLRFADPDGLKASPWWTYWNEVGEWQLSPRRLGNELRLHGERRGVVASCQRGRVSFITAAHAAGWKIATISRYVGHHSEAQTWRYVRWLGEDAEADALANPVRLS